MRKSWPLNLGNACLEMLNSKLTARPTTTTIDRNAQSFRGPEMTSHRMNRTSIHLSGWILFERLPENRALLKRSLLNTRIARKESVDLWPLVDTNLPTSFGFTRTSLCLLLSNSDTVKLAVGRARLKISNTTNQHQACTGAFVLYGSQNSGRIPSTSNSTI
jgi:hypothetical protein